MRHAAARPLLLALLALLAGCAPGRGLPPLAAAPPGPYRIGPGDELRLITVSDEALTGTFAVSQGGDIELPMLGRFHAAGYSAPDLGHALDAALAAAGLEHDPSVAVEVVGYRPVFVLGEVNKPGAFPYQPGMTVLHAVALAGGFTYRAVEGYAEVVRSDDGRPVAARAGPDSALEPDDVVRVFERRY
jgi:polysaccharide biosynthesis/export protein